MSELVQLSYNARKQSSGLAGAGEAPITAHHMNHKNCSSDNPQSLATSRQFSHEATSASQPLTAVNPLNSIKSQFRQLP